jgi:rubrerythrin
MRYLPVRGEWIAALVAAALAPAACGGSTVQATGSSAVDGGTDTGRDASADAGPPPEPVRQGFTKPSCAPGQSYLSSFVATPAFDYVELRVQDGYQTAPDEVLDRVGTLCANATNVATCKSAFAAVTRPARLTCSVPYPCSVHYLATTRGDEVRTYIAGKDDLAGLAAPIDSIAEALFVAGWDHPVTCENASYQQTADGFDIAYRFQTDRCSSGTSAVHDVLLHVTRTGIITVVEDKATPIAEEPAVACAAARRASDVVYEAMPHPHDPGAWLAHAAYLEAASVGSFARLARELAAHGAPAALVARVSGAAREERRHAQLLRRAARALGRSVPRSPKVARGVRGLEAIALENAIEGAARETWGAVVVCHQAERAERSDIRTIFSAIARDEASHAALAADIAGWLSLRLSPAANVRVDGAWRATIAALGASASRPVPEDVRVELGLPEPHVARRLFEAMRASLVG